MRLIFILSGLIFDLTAKAHTANLTGRLSTAVSSSVPYANVKIPNQAGSHKCQIAINDSLGNLTFKNLLHGAYTVNILVISFEPLKMENILIQGTAELPFREN